MTTSLQLRFSVPFLLLLVIAIGSEAVHGNPKRSVERVKERKLAAKTSSVKISDELLLQDSGNVLSGAGRITGYTYLISDMALSEDEKVIYYSEQAVDSDAVSKFRVNKADLAAIGSSATPSTVAGPWYQPSTASSDISPNSTTVFGILMLNRTNLLVADFGNNLLRTVDVTITSAGSALPHTVRFPLRLAKHPTQPLVFVSSYDRIYSVPLESGSTVTTLAGSNAMEASAGYVNSPASATVRFNISMIGARAVSRTGSWLYVADVGNNAVRRVNTSTGATETVASGVGLNGSPSGSTDSRSFFGPIAVALTSDACNLFIADFDPDSLLGAIHLLTFQQPDGNTTEVKTVAVAQINSASSSTGSNPMQFISLILSNDDQYLFASTSDGQIFKLRVNKSALRQCGASGSGNSKTVALAVGLSVAGVVVLLCICGFCGLRTVFIGTKRPTQSSPAVPGKSSGALAGQVMLAPNSVSEAVTVSAGTGSANDASNLGSGTSYTHSSSGQGKYRNSESLSVHGIKEFTLSEIAQATNNFGQDRLLEGGGFGDVYRAPLMVGNTVTDVAIKVMRGEFDELKYKQFVAEVNTLSRVAHRNLCKLLGYCAEDDKCILVYPFLTGGSLHDRLHQVRKPIGAQQNQHGAGAVVDERTVPLSWMDRMSIAEQTAAGLRYLHHDVDTPILHRDVKSRNVLMQRQGKHLAVYLIDFGLARSGNAPADDGQTFNAGQTVLTLTRSGTPGYMAPEYAIETKLTTMNDVYAFGVVLLELVTGRKAVIRTEEGAAMFLVAWSRQWLSRSDLSYPQLAEIVDHTLTAVLIPKEWEMVFKLAKLGYMCTLDIPKSRPTMIEVMERISSIFKDFQAAP